MNFVLDHELERDGNRYWGWRLKGGNRYGAEADAGAFTSREDAVRSVESFKKEIAEALIG